jgi:kynurenine formamidase
VWRDLTQPSRGGMPYFPNLPSPTFQVLRIPIEVAGGPGTMQVTAFSLLSHLGTHIDAPRHVDPEGAVLDAFPVDHFLGPAAVLRVSAERPRAIEGAELAAAGEVRRGDIVFIATGWARHYGQPAYLEYPYLADDAADWLVDRGARIVITDTLSPDMPAPLRTGRFVYPVHRRLLGAGVLIVENADLDGVADRRGTAIVLPMRLADADGAPVRILFRGD